jgi:hypothetical protein
MMVLTGNDVWVMSCQKTAQLQLMVRLLKLLTEMVVEIMFIMMAEVVVTAVKDVDGKSSAFDGSGNNNLGNSMDLDAENLDYDCNNICSLSEQQFVF